MNKEKFHIPMPDEEMLQTQIEQIVGTVSEKKVSFSSHLKLMYRQIGLRYLFSDRSEFVFALITVITFLGIFLFKPRAVESNWHDLYGYIFLISPLLFTALSVYTFLNKMMSGTLEVEMTCKFHVFQIVAFRMLLFSVIAIFFNTMTILYMFLIYENFDFLRAFMISNTGLFTFSVLFIFSMVKWRSTVGVATTIIGWTIGNLLFLSLANQLYHDILFHLPLFVYMLVIMGTSYFYLKMLKHFIDYQPAEGV